MDEIDYYGGVEKAIEEYWLQQRIARRALERKVATDAGERVVVGQNRYRREDQGENYGEAFRLDPAISGRVLEKLERLRQTRDAAAAKDDENLMPYLVDCCHAYATVGEMVARLKARWGEFQEPVRL